MNMKTKSNPKISPFVLYAIIAGAIHFVQCALHVQKRQVFLTLMTKTAASERATQDTWDILGNSARLAEVLYYLVTLLFFIYIAFQIMHNKLESKTAWPRTLILYGITAFLFAAASLCFPTVDNFLLPVFISFLLSQIILARAVLKRRHLLRLEQR